MNLPPDLDKILISLAKVTKLRLKKDWDLVIVIDGEEGIGKSTLAHIFGALVDPKYDLEKNVAYLPTYSQIEEKFHNLGKCQALCVDEASKVLYKLRWMDRLQIRINEMYQTERWQNKLTLLCIPRFWDLNEYFRNHRVKIFIHVTGRGDAIVFKKDDTNIFLDDPWRRRENVKIIDKYSYHRKIVDMTIAQKHSLLSKSRNFLFTFTFPDLLEPERKRYLELKKYYRTLARTSIKDEKDVQIRAVLQLSRKEINGKPLLTQGELAKAFGVAQSTISDWITKHKDKY